MADDEEADRRTDLRVRMFLGAIRVGRDRPFVLLIAEVFEAREELAHRARGHSLRRELSVPEGEQFERAQEPGARQRLASPSDIDAHHGAWFAVRRVLWRLLLDE